MTIRDAMERGDWDALSIEAIAERSGVSKATIYRRWLDKEGLLAELLTGITDAYPERPDTGDVSEDLLKVTRYLALMLQTPFGRSVTGAVAGSTNPELGAAAEQYWGYQFHGVSRLLQRYVRQGHIRPDADLEAIAELLLSPIYMRAMITKAELDTEALRQIVARAVGPYLVQD